MIEVEPFFIPRFVDGPNLLKGRGLKASRPLVGFSD
jgi:hypothetical protein